MHARGWRFVTCFAVLAALSGVGCGSRWTPGVPPPPNDNPPEPEFSVLEYHNGPSRSGVYVHSSFSRAAASGVHLVFSTLIVGEVVAQPLFIDGQGVVADMVFVATMKNQVFAIDASTGAVIWQKGLDRPLQRQALQGCGFFDPFGITGTPVIDKASRRIYFDLVTPDAQRGAKHLVYALSVDDGGILPGWPVDVGRSVLGFNDLVQQQRGALTLLNGRVYLPYGGYGDCGDYHGWVVGISTSNPASVTAWRTAGAGASIWAPSGIASDGSSLYVATGNGDPTVPEWEGSEAVFRLQPGPVFSGSPADYYVPLDWRFMDETDLDLGSSGVTLFDLPGPSPTPMLATLGKDGRIHLVSRANLGGVNGSMLVDYAALVSIITAPSIYTNSQGTHLVFGGSQHDIGCGPDDNVASFRISATPVLSISTEWCASSAGRTTSTIVTTTDGTSDSIVWVVDRQSEKLLGYDGDTGALLASADVAGTVVRYTAPMAAKGNIYVVGSNRLYAFSVLR